MRADWRDVGPSSQPLVVQISVDCSADALAELRRALEPLVTGALEIVREPGIAEPRVRIVGLNRFIAAPTCDRIRREVLALLARRH